MITLLLDQGLPLRAAADLRADGWDVVHVEELGMNRAPDPEIIKEALRRGATVVTRDSDFARLVVLAGAVSPSVITARVSLPRAAAVELLRELVPAVEQELRLGALITVTPAGVRVRTLPVQG